LGRPWPVAMGGGCRCDPDCIGGVVVALDDDFWEFHNNNPRVYEVLVGLARQMHGRGFSHYGIKTLWEVTRWQIHLETKDPSGFKLNNYYHSRYARLIMLMEPDLEGFFELRKLQTPSDLE